VLVLARSILDSRSKMKRFLKIRFREEKKNSKIFIDFLDFERCKKNAPFGVA